MPFRWQTLWQEMSADGVSDLAAGLAYRFLLAMFPFFIFLAAAAGFVAQWLHVQDPSARIVPSWRRTSPVTPARSLSGN